MAKPHVVVVPHPAQGHMNPMLKLAKLLYQKGFCITFVINEFNHNCLLRARGPNALDGLQDFKFAAIADGMQLLERRADGTPKVPGGHSEDLLNETPLPFLKQFVHDLRSSTNVPPITCMICDGLMSFSLKVAEEIDVPCAIFWTPSACGVLGYAYYRKLVAEGLIPLQGTPSCSSYPIRFCNF